MKTSVPLRRIVGATLVASAFFGSSRLMAIDLPDAASARSTGLGGYYKVSFSSDPLFPATETSEWFFDFGDGVRKGKSSGTVAISSRQNPHVRIHLMVWQVFPETGMLVIGKQTEEGSSRAVAVAQWKIGRTATGVSLQREGFQVSLRRAQADE